MFGFLIGAACLGGLIAILVHRRRHHYGGCGHGHGHGGRFYRRHGYLHDALDRLDTTPGQEKAIVAAIDEFRDAVHALRGKVMASRGELAAALRQDQFEPERVRGALARNAGELAALADTGTSTLAKIHEALDAEQRKRLARWLESGPGFLFG